GAGASFARSLVQWRLAGGGQEVRTQLAASCPACVRCLAELGPPTPSTPKRKIGGGLGGGTWLRRVRRSDCVFDRPRKPRRLIVTGHRARCPDCLSIAGQLLLFASASAAAPHWR